MRENGFGCSPVFLGGKMMRASIKTAIDNMRLDGASAAEIAVKLRLPASTIRSHIRRHPELPDGHICKNCGKAIRQPPGRKQKQFCSDKCRMAWWNSHREIVKKQTFTLFVCHYCGKEFTGYGNTQRKYCSRECYRKERKAVDIISDTAVADGEAQGNEPIIRG